MLQDKRNEKIDGEVEMEMGGEGRLGGMKMEKEKEKQGRRASDNKSENEMNVTVTD